MNTLSGDFYRLVEPVLSGRLERSSGSASTGTLVDTHGTTVIAVRYRDGVLNVADRRATAGFGVMYDRAEKILPLDDHTLVAVSGSFAKAVEIARFLRHAFKYYERSQLQPMSLEGKLAELTRAIERNIPLAMEGIGSFIPVLSAWDEVSGEGRIFFYDGLGARFENTEFGAAGSGSSGIRGVFDYIVRTRRPFSQMELQEALEQCLVLLDIAADLDAATGGYAKILPSAKAVTAQGILTLDEAQMQVALRHLQETGTIGLPQIAAHPTPGDSVLPA